MWCFLLAGAGLSDQAAEAEELQELLCSLKIVTADASTEEATGAGENPAAVNADNMQD